MVKKLEEELERRGIPKSEWADYVADPANKASLAGFEEAPKVEAKAEKAETSSEVYPTGAAHPIPENELYDYWADPANNHDYRYSDNPYTPKKEAKAETKEETYTESPEVAAARASLNELLKPTAFSSEWTEKLRGAIDEINGRKSFEYDPYGDILYQNYKDTAIRGAKRASEDATARAAALSGGYANSYAATVGNAAYNRQMSELADKVPELYQAALARYNAETSQLYDKANLYANMENKDYSRYRDAVSDYMNERNFAYQQERDAASDALNQQKFAYQQEQDRIANQLAADKFAYQKAQDELSEDNERRNAAVKLGLSPNATWEQISATNKAALTATETAEETAKPVSYDTLRKITEDFNNRVQGDDANLPAAFAWIESLVDAGQISIDEFIAFLAGEGLEDEYKEYHRGNGGANVFVSSDTDTKRAKGARTTNRYNSLN